MIATPSNHFPNRIEMEFHSDAKNFTRSTGMSKLLMVGFPLGFHDALHHLSVVPQAAITSTFGVRLQGSGYFLTDPGMPKLFPP
jgi:hypothetical protein